MEINFGAVINDLSKTVDCMQYDMLISKISAYNFSGEALSYIYLYLTNRKQYVQIKNTYNELVTITSGVLWKYILGSILFNLPINYLFYLVAIISL